MKLAVLSDFVEERWPSMDLVSDMFVAHAERLPGLELEHIRPSLPTSLRALTVQGTGSTFKRAGRPLALALGRYALYPLELPELRGRFDYFHVVDHSYAHLALALPAPQTGVFCHDLDAFRPLFQEGSSGWRRALAALLLRGLRRARVVFYSTEAVRAEIVERRLLPRLPAERLVAAPYGIAPEFQPEPRTDDARTRARPRFVLHVGSLIPRKNPKLLLETFRAVRRELGSLELVQVGGEWDDDARAFLEREGLAPFVHQLRGIPRNELSALYRAAGAVLLPSTSEGFGLPVTEALACGAVVVCSDLPVLRQVGGSGVVYAPTGELDAWRAAVVGALGGHAPSLSERLLAASKYTWDAHAATIIGAYSALPRGLD
jgi:glycosyltransferase involved in cell wall biosynthesis